MESEVWRRIINSVSLWAEPTDINLHKNLPALLPPLSAGNGSLTAGDPRINQGIYSRINSRPKSGNSQQSAKDQALRRCWLRKKLPQTDRQTPTPHLHSQSQTQQVSAPIYGKEKGFPLPATEFPSWFSWHNSLCAKIQALHFRKSHFPQKAQKSEKTRAQTLIKIRNINRKKPFFLY